MVKKLRAVFKLCVAYVDARLGLGLIAITDATSNASVWLLRHGYKKMEDFANDVENNREELGVTPEKYSKFCEIYERLREVAPEDWL